MRTLPTITVDELDRAADLIDSGVVDWLDAVEAVWGSSRAAVYEVLRGIRWLYHADGGEQFSDPWSDSAGEYLREWADERRRLVLDMVRRYERLTRQAVA